MKSRIWLWPVSVACSATLLLVAAGQDIPAPPKAEPPAKLNPSLPDGIQIENQGPVHEAFANPGDPVRGKAEGNTAPKAPPPRVPELPPEDKPTGDNVTWIPGYWQFDNEKKDFIWVSGFWRNAPPGRSWSAGEWRVENGQNRYIPGYWKPTNENSWRVDLPEPPQTVESGPNIPAPHKDAQWIPGQWVHRNENYVWQPGYWGEVENNMMWMPGQYNYTGSGYRYVTGYWDYCFEDRGLLYAPVYFSRPLWLNAGWNYTPCYSINVGLGGGWAWGFGGFYNNLYVGAGYGGFWFGNYGGWGGWGGGYRPWCWNGNNRYGNPAYNHYCWLNRNNPNWNNNLRQGYAARSMGVVPGPGRNVAGLSGGNRGRGFNQNTLNGATNLVSRVGGERAGQQFADRVQKGQTIQSVNQALKQTNSNNLVQPAQQVLRNQNVARTLPSPTTPRSAGAGAGAITTHGELANSLRNATLNSTQTGGARNTVGANTTTAGRTVSTSRPGLAANNETVLRNQINSAIRQAPTGSFDRNAAGSMTNNTARTTRNLGSDTQGIRSGSNINPGRSSSYFDSTAGRSSSMGSGTTLPNSGRSFSPPSSNMGSSSVGSGRGNYGGSGLGSGSMGGSTRGTISGGNPGGSSRGTISGGSMGGSSRGGFSGGSMGGGGSRGGSMGGGGGGGSRGGSGGGGKR